MENNLYQQLFNLFMEYKGIGFVSLQYRNKEGELSKRLLNVGAKFENAKKDDLVTLNLGVPFVESDKYTRAHWDMAVAELKQSLTNPDKVRSDAQKNAYVFLNEDNHSVKFNPNTLEVYLFAKSEKKEVLQAGVYKTVNSQPKTIAKKVIGEALKSTKFRTFTLKNVRGTVKVNGEVLEIVIEEAVAE